MRNPSGSHHERATRDGRYIEFHYKPLEDGSLLQVLRDITELKEREAALAAAKEAAEAALAQQTATAEVLQAINGSPQDLTPVFGIMLQKAMELCDATFGGTHDVQGRRVRTDCEPRYPGSVSQCAQRTAPA